MARYNGKGPDYCKNCGGDEGIHRGDDLACPANGVDQTGRSNPRYIEGIHFESQEWQEDIENVAAKVKETLFDEYFMAILNGCASGTVISHLTAEGETYESLIEEVDLVDIAYQLTLRAMKKRNEYMKSMYGQVGK